MIVVPGVKVAEQFEFGDDRGQSSSDGICLYVREVLGPDISLDGGVFRPNADSREGRNHHSSTVPYLEYYYPKYSCSPRFTWDEYILVEQDQVLPMDPGRSNGGYE
jgi:hypothetical protein